MNRHVLLNSNCATPFAKKLSVPVKLIHLGIDAVKGSYARWNPNSTGYVDNRYILQLRLNKMYKREEKTILMKHPIMCDYEICLIIDDLSISSNSKVQDEVIQSYFEILSSYNMEYIKHAITVTQLSKYFKTAKSKKVLMERYNLFLMQDYLDYYIEKNMGKVTDLR